jgi:hypothetical protein
MAGLILQVVTLVIFVALFVEYVVRYVRKSTAGPLRPRMKLFLSFLFLSILFVLVRCVYRIDELRDGYDGPLIRNEPLFMVLEAAYVFPRSQACFQIDSDIVQDDGAGCAVPPRCSPWSCLRQRAERDHRDELRRHH